MNRACKAGLFVAAVLCTSATTWGSESQAAPIRVGIIGLDTSHVVAFTQLINAPDAKGELAGAQVVAAFPGGNPDFPLSINRVDDFTAKLRGMGVEIVESIDELLPKVDAIMLESVDGSQHLEQARLVFKAGKPVFIDKPLAASLRDAVAIDRLARKHKVPWFTASSSRFTAGYRDLRNDKNIGQVVGCDAYSQSRAAPHHPDLFWYGVHGVDLLFTVMGTGCESVSAIQTPYTESVRGVWSGGRVGTYRSVREHTAKTGLGATVFGSDAIAYYNWYYDYRPLCAEVVKFFRTRKSPVPAEEMIEVFAFMEAAEQSKRRAGQQVAIREVMEAAKAAAARLPAPAGD